MLCRIYAVQMQPRKYVLCHAEYTAPSQQHELHYTWYRSGVYLNWKIYIIRWGSVVVRGHTGYVSGFRMGIWISLVKRISLLAAGIIAHSTILHGSSV